MVRAGLALNDEEPEVRGQASQRLALMR